MAVKETAMAAAAGASAPVVVEVAKNTLSAENTSSNSTTSSPSTDTGQDANDSQEVAASGNFQGVVTGPVPGSEQASVQQVPESPVTMLAIGLAIGSVALIKVLKKKNTLKADVKKI